MTSPVQDRNMQILQMREAGVPVKTIAQKFRISTALVHKTILHFRNQKLLEQKSAALIETIRQANDLDKKWHVNDFIEALRLLKVTQNGLIFHFAQENIAEISLREFMDLAIKGTDADGCLMSSLIRVRCVGKYGFRSVINRLTETDFGPDFNQEWKCRLALLQRCWRW